MWKSLGAHHQLMSGRISDVALFEKNGSSRCKSKSRHAVPQCHGLILGEQISMMLYLTSRSSALPMPRSSALPSPSILLDVYPAQKLYLLSSSPRKTSTDVKDTNSTKMKDTN